MNQDTACRACGYVVHTARCPARDPAARLRDLGCEVSQQGEQLRVIEPSGALRCGNATDREFWDALVVHLEGENAHAR
jgi:RNA polymerase subunit RPABC4/transcription elongation factor Spt4